MLVQAALYLVAILNLLLGSIVLSSGGRTIKNYFYFLFTFFVFLWTLGIGAFLNANNEAIADAWARTYYVSAAVIAYALYGLGLSFYFDKKVQHLRQMLAYVLPLIPLAVVLYISSAPGLIVYDVVMSVTQPNVVVLGPIPYSIYTIYFLLYILVCAYFFIAKFVRTDSNTILHQQVKMILVGLLFTGTIGVSFNLILPLFGNYMLIWVGPLFTTIMAGFIFYAIIRHGLFDIRLAVVRGAAYGLTLLTLAGVYYLVAYTISITFLTNQSTYIGQSPLNIALALLLAFIFQPIQQFFNRVTNRVFYRDNYNTEEFFARLSKRLSTTTDLRGLLQRATQEVSSTIKAEQGFVAISYGDGRFVTAGTQKHGRVTLYELQEISAYARENEGVAIVTKLLYQEEKLQSMLKEKGIELALPLMHENGVEGCLFLGAPQSRNYTKRDIRTLETIRDELVIAIQNALSVQEVREINATLQQRIKDATKKLRQSNNQLQRLDAAKDEFVSMASHQLRTPLTSVKGYISMVLEGDVGRISKEQRLLLEEAFTSSERMVHLIGDFLNVSRLQTGKFIIDTHPVDLAKVAKQEVDSIRQIASTHGVAVTFKSPSRFPELYIDENKIRQVIMNFMDNAIYYSPESQEIKVALSIEEGDAVLRVIDKGMGVPADVQKKLFTKFFRAENARRQRPDGTGIGLYLARKVIDGHGGSLVFESKEGKGSTFGFRLPIKKLSTPPPPQQEGA